MFTSRPWYMNYQPQFTDIHCVVLEIIHTFPVEGFFVRTPTPWKFQLNFMYYFKFCDLTEPPTPTPRKFQSLLLRECRYFLEQHIYKYTRVKRSMQYIVSYLRMQYKVRDKSMKIIKEFKTSMVFSTYFKVVS